MERTLLKRRLRRRHWSKSELRSTAYHEAGHTVIAFMVDMRSYEVGIVPDADKLGRHGGQDPLRGIHLDYDIIDARVKAKGIRRIRICLAGSIAQQKYDPRTWKGYHGGWDLRHAVDIAEAVYGNLFTEGRVDDDEDWEPLDGAVEGRATAIFDQLKSSTRALPKSRYGWHKVELLAAKLLKHDTLHRREIAKLLYVRRPSTPREGSLWARTEAMMNRSRISRRHLSS
jgi:hypothetical protein